MEKGPKRAEWGIRLIALTALVQGMISLPVWTGTGRTFPESGWIPGFSLPGGTEILLTGLAVLFLAMLMVRPASPRAAIGFAAVAGLFVLDDAARLQPWLFLYCILLVSGTIYLKQQRSDAFLSLVRWVLAGTYFWSGMQKINPWFVTEMFPWLGEGIHQNLPAWAGYVAAGLEAAAGIGLVIRQIRFPAILTLTSVHVFILLALGPAGHNWNEVVWPWNLLFLTLLWLSRSSPSLSFLPKSSLKYAVIGLTMGLPLLDFSGQGEHFLACGYYTQLAPSSIFYYHPTDRTALPAQTRPFQMRQQDKMEEYIVLPYWALAELKVPSYPEVRTYLAIGKKLCEQTQKPEKAGMRIEVRTRLGERELLEWTCGELAAW